MQLFGSVTVTTDNLVEVNSVYLVARKYKKNVSADVTLGTVTQLYQLPNSPGMHTVALV